ncbi:hypothetical protein ACFQ0B_46385 [Nonomuraea thailandensis]
MRRQPQPRGDLRGGCPRATHSVTSRSRGVSAYASTMMGTICVAVAGSNTTETGPAWPRPFCSTEAWMLTQRPLPPRTRMTAGPDSARRPRLWPAPPPR